MDTYIVKRLDQAKLLTDPFKLKLLERFAGKPATTKQVADRMGEKAPRLYRHVDALADAGLLELVEEKPKRGTIERYYRTVAARFEMHPNLFSASSGAQDDALDMVRGLFRDTESELVRFFEQNSDAEPEPENLPIVMRVAIRASQDEINQLREMISEWAADCEALADDRDDSPELVSYSGLLAFFPRPED